MEFKSKDFENLVFLSNVFGLLNLVFKGLLFVWSHFLIWKYWQLLQRVKYCLIFIVLFLLRQYDFRNKKFIGDNKKWPFHSLSPNNFSLWYGSSLSLIKNKWSWMNVCRGTVEFYMNDTNRKILILRKLTARFIVLIHMLDLRLKLSKGNLT